MGWENCTGALIMFATGWERMIAYWLTASTKVPGGIPAPVTIWPGAMPVGEVMAIHHCEPCVGTVAVVLAITIRKRRRRGWRIVSGMRVRRVLGIALIGFN